MVLTTGYITLRANRVLQGSAEEADRLKDDFISTEHLLLAITRERGGAAGRILIEADIDESKVNGVLKEIRGGRDPDNADKSVQPPKWKGRVLINPASLPRPVGFTHGILATGYRTLYLAGQTALDAEGSLVAPGDIVGQYRQVLSNLRAVVDAAGGEMANIVKMTIFVQDRDDYKAHLKELGEIHKEFFGSHYPATALLEVSRFFDDGVLVEIEGIAVTPMNFELTPEQQHIQSVARRFAEQELAPIARQADEEGVFPPISSPAWPNSASSPSRGQTTIRNLQSAIRNRTSVTPSSAKNWAAPTPPCAAS